MVNDIDTSSSPYIMCSWYMTLHICSLKLSSIGGSLLPAKVEGHDRDRGGGLQTEKVGEHDRYNVGGLGNRKVGGHNKSQGRGIRHWQCGRTLGSSKVQ